MDFSRAYDWLVVSVLAGGAALVVCVPLALWKLFDIARWLF